MLQQTNQPTKFITVKLPEDRIRGLGIQCREGAKGTVEVEKILDGSLAARQPINANDRLKSGDRITAVVAENGKRYPVNSPKALAKALEQNADGFKLEVIDNTNHKRQIYFPDVKPASTLGVRVRQSECEVLLSPLFSKGKRPAGGAVEVTTITTDFALQRLKLKDGDRIVGVKIGTKMFDIQTPKDLETAIGNMIPGEPVSVVVGRYDPKENVWKAKTLSSKAPRLSEELPRNGGLSAKI